MIYPYKTLKTNIYRYFPEKKRLGDGLKYHDAGGIDDDVLTGFHGEKAGFIVDDGAESRDGLGGGLAAAEEGGDDDTVNGEAEGPQPLSGSPSPDLATIRQRRVPGPRRVPRPHQIDVVDPVPVPHHHNVLHPLLSGNLHRPRRLSLSVDHSEKVVAGDVFLQFIGRVREKRGEKYDPS